ncbi:MFS transporter [Pseudomonas syringae]|nr:MFS transporter [Pseudomonas syringae]
MDTSFWKAGHRPTLFAAFLYFDLSFMVWYLLGPMAVQIATDLHLTTQQRGLMVATPILAGAVLRFFMGLLADQLSPKTAGIIGQVIVIGALFTAWQLGIHSYEQVLLLGLFLGMAGASFAVALPLASQWYPPQHQGKAMGIAGAGNSGTVLAALIAPVLAASFGWGNVFGLALIPLVILWFGIDETAKIFLVALGTLFPIYLNTYHGIRNIDPALVEMSRSYGLSGFSLFRHVILPGAMPSILVGVRFALGFMWLTLIVAETISASSGIGYLAMNAREFLQTDIVVLAIVLYAVLGKLADLAARGLERVCLRWHPAYQVSKGGAA